MKFYSFLNSNSQNLLLARFLIRPILDPKFPLMHLIHLEQVLYIFKENKFYANMSKCTFGKEEVSYLSHVISKEGVKVDLEKIKSITEWPKLTNISKLRGFLGLTRYYRKIHLELCAHNRTLIQASKKECFSVECRSR